MLQISQSSYFLKKLINSNLTRFLALKLQHIQIPFANNELYQLVSHRCKILLLKTQSELSLWQVSSCMFNRHHLISTCGISVLWNNRTEIIGLYFRNNRILWPKGTGVTLPLSSPSISKKWTQQQSFKWNSLGADVLFLPCFMAYSSNNLPDSKQTATSKLYHKTEWKGKVEYCVRNMLLFTVQTWTREQVTVTSYLCFNTKHKPYYNNLLYGTHLTYNKSMRRWVQRDVAETEGSSPGINVQVVHYCALYMLGCLLQMDEAVQNNTNIQCTWHCLSDGLNLITSFCGVFTVLFIFLTNAIQRGTVVAQWPRLSHMLRFVRYNLR